MPSVGEALEHADRPDRVGHHLRLGDLEHQHARIDVVSPAHRFELTGEVEVDQAARREVHRDRQLDALLAPAAGLLQRTVEHECGHRSHLARCLRPAARTRRAGSARARGAPSGPGPRRRRAGRCAGRPSAGRRPRAGRRRSRSAARRRAPTVGCCGGCDRGRRSRSRRRRSPWRCTSRCRRAGAAWTPRCRAPARPRSRLPR